MQMFTSARVSLMVLTCLVLAVVDSHGQADPEWLKSWTEAQEGRPALITSRGRIATHKEPGASFIVRGTVLNPDGTPASGVVVHAYHRDSHGMDFGPGDNTLSTWRLQGWAQTGADGQFEFHTIRPAPDHLHREGAHLHFTLISEEFGRQWAPTTYLSDDPKVSEKQKLRSKQAGKFGAVRDVKVTDEVQYIEVQFKLKTSADF